jgi:hypothetical protein
MKQHQPFIKKTPASPAMEFCVQKMVFFASEGRMYQENILAGCIRKIYCKDHIFESKENSVPLLSDPAASPQKAIFYILKRILKRCCMIRA